MSRNNLAFICTVAIAVGRVLNFQSIDRATANPDPPFPRSTRPASRREPPHSCLLLRPSRCGAAARPDFLNEFKHAQRRALNLHEYHCHGLMKKFGINTPKSEVAFSAAQAEKAARDLGWLPVAHTPATHVLPCSQASRTS